MLIALILALIWRRIPGVCTRQRMLARERVWFVTRMREQARYTVHQGLVSRAQVRDQIIQLGGYKGNGQGQHSLRLVAVFVNHRWQR